MKYLIKKTVVDEEKGIKNVMYKSDVVTCSNIELAKKTAFNSYNEAHYYMVDEVMRWDNMTKGNLKISYEIIEC